MTAYIEPTKVELDAWKRAGTLDDHDLYECGHTRTQHMEIVSPEGRSFKTQMPSVMEKGGGTCRVCKCSQFTFQKWVK